MAATATAILPRGDNANPIAIGTVWMEYFTIAFSGNYATGGDSWDPTPNFPASSGQILVVDFSGGAGYGLEYDAVNKKIKVFSAAGTELAAGAYPAALTGDVNVVAQVFVK